MVEIERKFLVNNQDYQSLAVARTQIEQGFLSTDPLRTVRVRLQDDMGYLTIKGKTDDSGTTRSEWEYEIPASNARELLELCEGEIISKTRYSVVHEGKQFEVDEFLGRNAGLIVAEIELKSADEAFGRPDWLGREITGITDYYNSQLSLKPFDKWEQEKG